MLILIPLVLAILAYVLFQYVVRSKAGGVKLIEWSKAIRIEAVSERKKDLRIELPLLLLVGTGYLFMPEGNATDLATALLALIIVLFAGRISTAALNRTAASKKPLLLASSAGLSLGLMVAALASLDDSVIPAALPIGAAVIGLRKKKGVLKTTESSSDVFLATACSFPIIFAAPVIVAADAAIRILRSASAEASAIKPPVNFAKWIVLGALAFALWQVIGFEQVYAKSILGASLGWRILRTIASGRE